MGWSEVFFKEVRGALLMVAALIATVTFSSGITPPGGFWQDEDGHTAGKPILADKNKLKYDEFMTNNTRAFIQSLLLIMLLIFSYATPCRRLLMPLVFCVAVSLLLTLVLMGMAYSTGSSGMLPESAFNSTGICHLPRLPESASNEMLCYALIYLAALSIVIFVAWIMTCLGLLAKWIISYLGRLAKRLTIRESRAAAAGGAAYDMEDWTGRGP